MYAFVSVFVKTQKRATSLFYRPISPKIILAKEKEMEGKKERARRRRETERKAIWKYREERKWRSNVVCILFSCLCICAFVLKLLCSVLGIREVVFKFPFFSSKKNDNNKRNTTFNLLFEFIKKLKYMYKIGLACSWQG